MSSIRLMVVLLLLIAINTFSRTIHSATGDELAAAYKRIVDCKMEFSSTLTADSLTIVSHDFTIFFETGRIAFLLPLKLDSVELYYGAYFEGKGRIQFKPRIDLERDQLRRFFNTEKLDSEFKEMLLLFDDSLYTYIKQNCRFAEEIFGGRQEDKARDKMQQLTEDEEHFFTFRTLENRYEPHDGAFLLVNVNSSKYDRLFYMFDPLAREEISLYKEYFAPGVGFMELICSYSQDAIAPHHRLGGYDKAELGIRNYDIDAEINRNGTFTGKVEILLQGLVEPVQCLSFYLHSKLEVDSIKTDAGVNLNFLRYDKDSHRKGELFLFLDKVYRKWDYITLDFFYHGDIADNNLGVYYVTASSAWYPRQLEGDSKSTFSLKFRTPYDCRFLATGNKLSEKTEDPWLYTEWQIADPTDQAGFTVGYLKEYHFTEPDVPAVDIYYDDNLHWNISRIMSQNLESTTSHMEKVVASEAQNAWRLFTHYFGTCPVDHLKISEVMAYHGQSFPGFIHLGIHGWVKDDREGFQASFCAHEVAHQWWGIGVDFETYHDQWLSEGFAEYSGMMFVQAVKGNKAFLDMLKDYRKDILDVRDYIFASGTESGPIIMGRRTQSTETEGDYGLIIYRKGAYVLHMLRNLMIDYSTMNEDPFLNMMKDFYGSFYGKKATTEDFRLIVEKHIGIDMSWFFEQWIYRNEIPKYKFSYKITENETGKYIADCEILTENVSDDFKMYLPLEIEFGKDRKAYVRYLIDKKETRFQLPPLDSKPKKITLNPFESVLADIDQ